MSEELKRTAASHVNGEAACMQHLCSDNYWETLQLSVEPSKAGSNGQHCY